MESIQVTSTSGKNLDEFQRARRTRRKKSRRTHARRQTERQVPGGRQLVEQEGTTAVGREAGRREEIDLGHLNK